MDGLLSIVWKRPWDICRDPKLFVGGANRMDVNLYGLGDSWLLAALASLTTNEKLLLQIIPSGQSFEVNDYVGAFHFRFW